MREGLYERMRRESSTHAYQIGAITLSQLRDAFSNLFMDTNRPPTSGSTEEIYSDEMITLLYEESIRRGNFDEAASVLRGRSTPEHLQRLNELARSYRMGQFTTMRDLHDSEVQARRQVRVQTGEAGMRAMQDALRADLGQVARETENVLMWSDLVASEQPGVQEQATTTITANTDVKALLNQIYEFS